jgi:anti-sigma regulatory factor (Ser/Thr protein kinase)
LILTSNSVEKNAVKNIMGPSKKVFIGQTNQGAYLGLVGDFLALHLSGDSGISHDQSIGRIASTFLRSQTMPHPRLVLLTGFCWRNPKTTPDSVLIVSPTVHCANVQHSNKGAQSPQVKTRVSPITIDDLKAARLSEALSKAICHPIVGPIASAETLYMDSDLRDQLTAQLPGLLGGEMEAFGFLDSSFPWLVLKAASDAGGCDFNRERQAEAAEIAANAILPIITELEDLDAIKKEDATRNAPVRELVDGDVIEFDATRQRVEQLNDLLDGEFGPRIEYRLRRYLSPDGYGQKFLGHAVDALLELAQNAVRHGRANLIQFRFTPNQIVVTDDGNPFNPRTLTGAGRGGTRAFQMLLEHEAAGDVLIEVNISAQELGNSYAIHLPKADAAVDQARRVCQIQVIENVIGVGYGRPVLFEFDRDCKTLYLDTTQVRMSSRKYSLAEEVRMLVKQGKRIFVGCADDEDLLLFKEELRDLPGSDVTVFIDARLSVPADRYD